MSEINQTENLDIKLEEVNKEIDNLVEQGEKDAKVKKKLRGKIRLKNITIVVLLIIIIILLLKSCSTENTPVKLMPDLETGELFGRVDEISEVEFIDVPVVASFSVTERNPYCNLSNPETNADKFYLVYEFYHKDAETPYYASKYVEPTKEFSADIYNALEGCRGSYYTTVVVRTYDMDTLEEQNGATFDIVVTVK